jgi:hypothetical protein
MMSLKLLVVSVTCYSLLVSGNSNSNSNNNEVLLGTYTAAELAHIANRLSDHAATRAFVRDWKSGWAAEFERVTRAPSTATHKALRSRPTVVVPASGADLFAALAVNPHARHVLLMDRNPLFTAEMNGGKGSGGGHGATAAKEAMGDWAGDCVGAPGGCQAVIEAVRAAEAANAAGEAEAARAHADNYWRNASFLEAARDAAAMRIFELSHGGAYQYGDSVGAFAKTFGMATLLLAVVGALGDTLAIRSAKPFVYYYHSTELAGLHIELARRHSSSGFSSHHSPLLSVRFISADLHAPPHVAALDAARTNDWSRTWMAPLRTAVIIKATEGLLRYQPPVVGDYALEAFAGLSAARVGEIAKEHERHNAAVDRLARFLLDAASLVVQDVGGIPINLLRPWANAAATATTTTTSPVVQNWGEGVDDDAASSSSNLQVFGAFSYDEAGAPSPNRREWGALYANATRLRTRRSIGRLRFGYCELKRSTTSGAKEAGEEAAASSSPSSSSFQMSPPAFLAAPMAAPLPGDRNDPAENGKGFLFYCHMLIAVRGEMGRVHRRG